MKRLLILIGSFLVAVWAWVGGISLLAKLFPDASFFLIFGFAVTTVCVAVLLGVFVFRLLVKRLDEV